MCKRQTLMAKLQSVKSTHTFISGVIVKMVTSSSGLLGSMYYSVSNGAL